VSEPAERRRRGALMVLAVVLGMGPTVGDIGSCSQSPDPLDPGTFFDIKAGLDCERCGECGLRSKTCARACNQPPPTTFPQGCRPLVHDGEVCLRALIHASCDDYASYVDDTAPTAPSECQFCPAR
jgi:hypothetical protein